MQNPKYGEVDRMHYIMQTDPSKMMFVRELEKDILEFKYEFQQHVHELIKLRNKIFNTQQKFKIIDNPERAGLDPKNVAKFVEFSKNLENQEKYSVYNFYNIKKKKQRVHENRDSGESLPDTETYDVDEIALTDSDQEMEPTNDVQDPVAPDK